MKKPTRTTHAKHQATATRTERVDSVTTGSEIEYARFIPHARALSPAEIVPMRADLQLALQNTQIGVASVMAEKDRLEALPETEVDLIASLPQLILATIYANTQIVAISRQQDLPKMLERASALRTLLLKIADGLAEAGWISRAAVDKIRAGSGRLDTARDCVALAALFSKNAAKLRGKHPITPAQIKEADDVGRALQNILKSVRGRPVPRDPALGVGDRDRLWTLVLQRSDALFRAGAYLFGRDLVDTKVPPLQASRGKRGRKSGTGTAGTGAPATASAATAQKSSASTG